MLEDEDWGWEGAFEPEKSRQYLLWEKLIWWAVFGSVALVGLLGLGTVIWLLGYTILRVVAMAKGGGC